MDGLDEKQIQAQTSAQSFERGQSYYRNGRVLNVVQRGQMVMAEVGGSDYEPYQVQVTLAEDGIEDATCSCPYDWGGYCKHIVAVLLTMIHQADAVMEKADLATLLAGLTETQLRQVFMNVAAEWPALVEAVEREVTWLRETPTATAVPGIGRSAPLVDVTAVRREMHKDFRQAGIADSRYDRYDYYGDEHGEIDLDAILEPHLEKVDELLAAGDVETAVTVITAIIEAYEDGLTELDEWVYEANEYVFEETSTVLGAVLAEVLLSQELSPAERDAWLAQIDEWEGEIGDMGMAVTAVEQGWTYPPLVATMQGTITEKGAWAGESPHFADELAQVRLRILERQGRFQEYIYLAEAEGQLDLYVNMLAHTGQVARALSEARQYLAYPTQILALAGVLTEQSENVAALEIGEYGLGLAEQAGKKELAQWLRDQAEQAGRPSLALQAAKIAFKHSCTLADYQAVARLAGNEWDMVKLELLPTLVQSGYGGQAVEIYLHEGMLKEAMKKVESASQLYTYNGTLQKVVEATREKYPEWGIQKYQKLAEGIMDAGKAQHYDTAVSWLRQARDIYKQHHRQTDWEAYLDSLLATHQRKYKLVPMLRALR